MKPRIRALLVIATVATIAVAAVALVPERTPDQEKRTLQRDTSETPGDTRVLPTITYGAGNVWESGIQLDLLARVITGEAQGEPYEGQVAVAAVILNRVRHPSFPNTLAGVVYEPWAFESVDNGLIWARTPSGTSYSAAWDALSGWDPSWGAIYFWNPATAVSWWVWTRPIITYIGRHVFAR